MREAIVNAFIHRSFRVNQPIQIIRYSNRLEIINPGYSLKSPERLGEPGSELRNQYISSIFHETNLAETKGSGIKTMREQMKKAKLMPPTFESSRENNQFTTRLLFHHLLGKEDIEWLSLFAQHELNNEQRLSLIFVRELGAIDNITYRQLNSDITSRKATFDLHRMCEMGLFELKGQSRNAYYIAGPNLEPHIGKNDGEMCRANREISRGDGEMCRANDEMCRANGEMYRADGEISRGDGEISRGDGEISRAFPETVINRIRGIKKWAPADEMEKLILEMCEIKPLSLNELSELLSRRPTSIRYQYINPLLKQGKLFYTIPEMLNHPNQKYTTKKKQ